MKTDFGVYWTDWGWQTDISLSFFEGIVQVTVHKIPRHSFDIDQDTITDGRYFAAEKSLFEFDGVRMSFLVKGHPSTREGVSEAENSEWCHRY